MTSRLGRDLSRQLVNLSSDKFHYIQNARAHQFGATADQAHLLGFYRPAVEPPAAILSRYRAHLEFMVEMQRIGYVYGTRISASSAFTPRARCCRTVGQPFPVE